MWREDGGRNRQLSKILCVNLAINSETKQDQSSYFPNFACRGYYSFRIIRSAEGGISWKKRNFLG